jgi:alginate O-acetyltransferase complex protein AlgI
VVLVGWVFFRAGTFNQALAYLANMGGFTFAKGPQNAFPTLLTHQETWALIAAIILSTPFWAQARDWTARKLENLPGAWGAAVQSTGACAQFLLAAGLLIISSAWLAGGTYNPFIYFRF